MSTRMFSVGLATCVAGLVAFATAGSALAVQEKGKDATGELKFEIYQDNAKEYRWRLKSANGKVLATPGQGYKAKAACKKAVERIKADADKLKFETYQDNQKEYRWRLKAANGQVIGASSESYKAKPDCEKAVEEVKKGAGKAEVEEK